MNRARRTDVRPGGASLDVISRGRRLTRDSQRHETPYGPDVARGLAVLGSPLLRVFVHPREDALLLGLRHVLLQ